MVRSGWCIGPTEFSVLSHIFYFFYFFPCLYSTLNYMQVISFLLKADLKWHFYCGSAWYWWNRKRDKYRLETPSCWITVYRVWFDLSVLFKVFVCYGVRCFTESDLAPTRDRKGLLSLSLAWVVFTPLSRIIPAWMKLNYMSRDTGLQTDAKEKKNYEQNSEVDLHRADSVWLYSLHFF